MVISVIGYPWSGKSELVTALSSSFSPHIPAFNVGKFVRELGLTADDIEEIRQNDLSSRLNDQVNDMVVAQLKQSEDLILDGYPRSAEQCDILAKYAHTQVISVWMYSNPVKLLDRIRNRGRLDDDVEVVRGRVEAARSYRETLYSKATLHGWDILDRTLDDSTIKNIVEDVMISVIAKEKA